ncbi:MAG: T9SS type A sorting domain-containing protein [Bacteroidales bacterium]|nr:T9SS type A sorting domain-containing protein [Bacteroidales bacterium]
MKHNYKSIAFFSTILFFLSLATGISAQNPFQLPNGGFEQWDNNDITAEPSHWNSFATCDGSYASLASTPHHYHRNGSRPGGNGSHYLTIYTKSIMGIKANGNMTTGRIHAGAMSASSSENYNYTQRSNGNHCQPFTATPDSMYVWVSFYAKEADSRAQIEAVIHGDNDFRAPNDISNTSLFCARAVAQTSRTTSNANTMQWQQLKVPFNYNGTAEAQYILINITTNYIPGEGSGNDSLSIDDIEFIYSAWLESISVGGIEIEDFNRGCLEYFVHVDDSSDFSLPVTCITQASDATVQTDQIRLNDTSELVTLSVTAEDGTTKVYSVTLTTGAPLLNIAQHEEEVLFTTYPSPTHGNLTIKAYGTVTVHDSHGRELMQLQCDGEKTVDISRLPDGVYFLSHNGKRIKIVKI